MVAHGDDWNADKVSWTVMETQGNETERGLIKIDKDVTNKQYVAKQQYDDQER
jgi:hypothetical protein